MSDEKKGPHLIEIAPGVKVETDAPEQEPAYPDTYRVAILKLAPSLEQHPILLEELTRQTNALEVMSIDLALRLLEFEKRHDELFGVRERLLRYASMAHRTLTESSPHGELTRLLGQAIEEFESLTASRRQR